jgi:hypothetical protein
MAKHLHGGGEVQSADHNLGDVAVLEQELDGLHTDDRIRNRVHDLSERALRPHVPLIPQQRQRLLANANPSFGARHRVELRASTRSISRWCSRRRTSHA